MQIHWRSLARSLLGVMVLSTVLAALPIHSTEVHADVNNYQIDTWSVSTHLSADEDGRAVAYVTETVTPVFPEHDQNRGMVRGLPLTYADASIEPHNISVTDGAGQSVPFETEEDGTFLVVLIGDDSYVHGPQHYELHYELRDVIRPFAATSTQPATEEWYWDIIPLERPQAVSAASARVTLDDSLASQLTGEHACYTGAADAETSCTLNFNSQVNEFLLAPIPLEPNTGVTLAIGFNPGTVTQPAVRLPDPLLDFGPIALGVLTLLLGTTTAAIVWVRKHRSAQHRGTIIAQYEAPTHLPPLLAGPIVGRRNTVIAAQIVHLAVTGALRLEENIDQKKNNPPQLRLIDPARAADALDTQMLHKLFGESLPGTLISIPTHSEVFSKKMADLKTAGAKAAEQRGFLTSIRLPLAQGFGYSALVAAIATVVLLIAGSDRNHPETWLWALPTLIVGFLLGFTGVMRARLHTTRGAEYREYLLGLKKFITVAEGDRLRSLQSVTGAERAPQVGSAAVIKIYEQLLPYAILFGEEKEWARVLESEYVSHEHHTPLWYPTLGAVGLSQLDRSLAQLTRDLSSAASYTASDTGGASGGGYSGGGGGGGFSGGR